MKRTSSPFPQLLLVGLLVVAMSVPAFAKFALPQPTPVARLLRSAEAYVAKHPQEVEAHYGLARIHYLAFHLKRDHVPAFDTGDRDGLPQVAPQWMVWGQPPKDAKTLAVKDVLSHASKAMAGFKKVLVLNPKHGWAQLGIASLMEEFSDWSRQVKVDGISPDLAGVTLAKVRAAYARALTITLPSESKLESQPVSGLRSITAYEAASALVRLSTQDGAKLTDTERNDVKLAQSALTRFNSLKMEAITPIVFSFQPVANLEVLLAPEVSVDFDLRGYGPRERWPWVKPELGFLVWDPEGTGQIRSARQLFGGYTFELFRANGYDALAALDDDGDSKLSGAELIGIRAWFDRNSDGKSSRDEVTSLDELGVESIDFTMAGYDGIHPTNARGITLRDGWTLRTWDWIVEPRR